MGRLTDVFARPSAWLALVGAVLLAVAAAWSLDGRFGPDRGAGCPAVRPGGPAERMRIVDVGTAELEPGGSVCLIVDNVVADASLRRRRAVLATTQAELAEARAALVTAEAPPRPIPVWESRFGVRPLSPEALAERRREARARRDAAQARFAAASAALDETGGDRKLVLFLGDERAAAVSRTVRGVAAPQVVTFRLLPSESPQWRRLTARGVDGGVAPVTLGIAPEGQPRATATMRATLARNGGTSAPIGIRIYRPAIGWLAGSGLALLIVGLASLARTTALLREGRSRYSPYSLAQMQMAWWLALTVGGFLYVWIVTGRYLELVGPPTFVLLAMAGATAGAARAIDRAKESAKPLSQGLVADMLGSGRIELQRLQLVLWSIVLGAIFAWKFLTDFTLGEIDGSLLALSAMVNAIYLVLKTQEA